RHRALGKRRVSERKGIPDGASVRRGADSRTGSKPRRLREALPPSLLVEGASDPQPAGHKPLGGFGWLVDRSTADGFRRKATDNGPQWIPVRPESFGEPRPHFTRG